MFARYKDMVEWELSQAVPAPSENSLNTLMQYHLGWVDQSGKLAPTSLSQGKALRPTLCVFACEALGGDIQQAMPAAAALELIHNFSLMHDDIQDQDLERRHQATVWVLWGASQSLVAGDLLVVPHLLVIMLSYDVLMVLIGIFSHTLQLTEVLQLPVKQFYFSLNF